MKYKNRHFYIENVSAERIAKYFGTPLYVYSYAKIKNNINNFKNKFKTINPLICFSVKSNSNLKILDLINKFGLGADVVSSGELITALEGGVNPKDIFLHGNNKSDEELFMGYRNKRFSIWFDKICEGTNISSELLADECYQIFQSKVAISSGGLFGLGPGTSRARWGSLPNSWSDFIASIAAEEYGFFGLLLIVIGLVSLIISFPFNSSDPIFRRATCGLTL